MGGNRSSTPPDPFAPSTWERARRRLMGKPRDLQEKGLFEKLALIPFLAWVGLGADGLSSSSYGPQEAFLALGEHKYLAVVLALATTVTIAVIAAAYSRIIERFPHGGGGYIVATQLLGKPAGVLSGCALLVDYMLTITVSIAASGDALFSFLPPDWAAAKLPFEVAVIVGMTALNLRGVRDSVVPLVPVFLLFVVTHLALIGGALLEHAFDAPRAIAEVSAGFDHGYSVLGLVAMLALSARAWSLGGGTYTGLEAVSNGLPILKEPKVRTAHRTMLYMALSLAFTAGGLLICYVLVGVGFEDGKTLNAVLSEAVFGNFPGGGVIVVLTLLSEGLLLMVGAQAGFIDGPRVLANMALDGWMPRRFSSLSHRLTSGHGIVLMGSASLLALLYTGGQVSHLVVMYSINVFLTFSLSMAGMLRAESRPTDGQPRHIGRIGLFGFGLLLCASILGVTTYEKFAEGGWLTVAVTAGVTGLCFVVRAHYRSVGRLIAALNQEVPPLPAAPGHVPGRPDLHQRTAAILVGSYGGLGITTTRDVLREFKGLYKNLVFVSVGVVDSAAMRGEGDIDSVRLRTDETCRKYVELAHRFGLPATHSAAVATDAVESLERQCNALANSYSEITFFAGQLVFERERWFHHWLHNDTAFELQKRLQLAGQTLVILPRLVRWNPSGTSG